MPRRCLARERTHGPGDRPRGHAARRPRPPAGPRPPCPSRRARLPAGCRTAQSGRSPGNGGWRRLPRAATGRESPPACRRGSKAPGAPRRSRPACTPAAGPPRPAATRLREPSARPVASSGACLRGDHAVHSRAKRPACNAPALGEFR
ncbi:MAG: hypothetical protein AMJ58_07510 [Gammaproteobacteria bacterium SG8_30]|nr:MAG: hypothetical protein AMJ58_07510 [Gammaproteobacteria bacterium SG8_30]